MNAKISETLGLVPMHKTKSEITINEPDNTEDIDRDYARENIKNIIEGGAEALDSILDIAQATEDPKAFEIYGGIMKVLVDANRTLVGISAKNKKAPAPTTITTNNLYTGTTQDILKELGDKKNE